ncbi:MAG TPA: cation-translocating P-type ATPase [Rhodocyclaceae bacterium]|nr:cation-translocating P-type ATPase [Rhodocyclaceae bacterium]HRQ47280.1 cation-translocating P-type ATPase [Rhodocyclaceae bacterium]
MIDPLPDNASGTPTGLSAEEAARRLAADGPNALPGSAPKSTAAIVRGVVSEPMFLMLLAAGALYLALGDRAEALFLLGFVVVVIGIALAQERRTQRALESLRDLSAPRALVIRDGKELRIAGRDVVCGDVLVLHEGDRVPADALLLDGQLSADESLLTGEAVPASKVPAQPGTIGEFGLPGGDGTPFLFASSVVTRGIGVAEVRAVAGATAVGRIGEALAATTEPPSALQRNSRRLVRNLGIGAVLLAVALVLLGWLWNERSLPESLLSGIALAMAILPEEIPVILTVFLALGAWRIAQQQVLTRRVSAVEALGAITVLAVDKTGTLTQNRMTVAEVATADAHFVPGAATDLPEAFHPVVEFAMLATPADPFDPMEKAIQAFGRHWLAGTEHVHDGHMPEFEYPLSGEIMAMTRVFSGVDPSRYLLAAKGAPEAVADLCHLPVSQREAIRSRVEQMAERGLRVLGVAKGRWSAPSLPGDETASPDWPASQHDFDFEFLGLVGLADPPREDVPGAIAQCRAAGVRVIMMTGDHPATALAIARQVGLSERPEIITGPEIASLSDDALRARIRQADICARLQPEHKLRLVKVLRGGGEVVAMTGDGVNDAPALKAADVGVAMGERGTDVAREAAALVLLDDSFVRIVAAIRQGRRIFDNIGKATRFVFAVHVPIIALALVPALLNWPILLLPVHIVLLELLIDPACSVVFEAEPEAADVMSRPPRAFDASPFSLDNLFQGALQGIGLAAILLVGHGLLAANGMGEPESRSAVFAAMVIGVVMLILANRSPVYRMADNRTARNPWLGWMIGAVALLLVVVIAIPALRQIMGLALPDGSILLAAAAMSALGAGWLVAMRRTVRIWRSAS